MMIYGSGMGPWAWVWMTVGSAAFLLLPVGGILVLMRTAKPFERAAVSSGPRRAAADSSPEEVPAERFARGDINTVFECAACGHTADRDLNAARMIVATAERHRASADDVRHQIASFRDGGSDAVRAGDPGPRPEGNPPDLSGGIINGRCPHLSTRHVTAVMDAEADCVERRTSSPYRSCTQLL